ncbi:hypothetical protein [Nonomuraea diastatica]|uniref:hypothetical protein n=1 Tax=Nonomuraea diastatica TaxID=1848329 RepID=UPI001C6FE2A8|nr:hypothetical protein [Nonomuraea diastatica]
MKIVFLGAGSVEFTQGLLADLVAFPDLGKFEVALHDSTPSGSTPPRPPPASSRPTAPSRSPPTSTCGGRSKAPTSRST